MFSWILSCIGRGYWELRIRLSGGSFRPAASLVFIVDMAAAIHILYFYLQGGVMDLKLVAQMFGGLVQKGIIAALWHDQMSGEHGFRSAGRPDMEIVDALYPR
jgi:hypothetical protein